MKPMLCPYRGDDDYWRIRAFLRDIFPADHWQQQSWPVAALDYWRWLSVEGFKEHPSLEATLFRWEAPEGQIVAALNPEGPGEAYLHVRPEWRTPEMEADMVITAEECLAIPGENGTRRLRVWAREHDALLQDILKRRGYVKGEWPAIQRWRLLDGPIPEPELPPGFVVRSLGDEQEIPLRAWTGWRTFNPDAPEDQYIGSAWYAFIQMMPLYRRDLDLVVIAPNGDIAAFCGVWYDDVTRVGYFEPVGTNPAYQRRGMGKAVMFEAMRRAKRLGATKVTVYGYSPEANALYNRVMTEQCVLNERWEKEW